MLNTAQPRKLTVQQPVKKYRLAHAPVAPVQSNVGLFHPLTPFRERFFDPPGFWKILILFSEIIKSVVYRAVTILKCARLGIIRHYPA
ncbi:hypothetical protein [Ralstonia sp. A12]|uniref:hypothetical protein n=1 Tax=Ralstonia sp. A12 TaxID=1217052 RepID=UPI0012EE5F2D|nr:hypothetical protein [Ralstonia sp. A12]